MQTATFFWIFLAFLLAAALAGYHYLYRSGRPGRLWYSLTFLRFLSWFSIFLLVLEVQWTGETYSLDRPNLVILADNTSSMSQSEAAEEAREIIRLVSEDPGVEERFNRFHYRFATALERQDSLSFDGAATNISAALEAVGNVFREHALVLLLTDGNQTLGEDYEFASRAQRLPVYAVALGDTSRYADLRIEDVNLNKFAFLGNRYPLEVRLAYDGSAPVRSRLEVRSDGKKVWEETISFSARERTHTASALLTAGETGIRQMTLRLSPLENERNVANNERSVAIEVIDERTRVAMISSLEHPDLGTLEKAIEGNEQREVEIVGPETGEQALAEFDVFLLYQPTSAFRGIYPYLKKTGAPYFTITGPETDWAFLNGAQDSFEKDALGQFEEISGVPNPGFSLFDPGELIAESFPPLQEELGEVLIPHPYEMLLEQRIRGVNLQEPLLAFINRDGRKEGILFGEGIWKWRMQEYRNSGSFDAFDALFGKILLYLSNAKGAERFSLTYEPLYRGSAEAHIRASYVDEALRFDPDAAILLRITGKENSVNREVPMMVQGTGYEADLSDLPPGNYTFQASVSGTPFEESGAFSILDFDIEKQLLVTDHRKLGRLSEETGGAFFFPSGAPSLVDSLLSDSRFLPVQKSHQKVVSLIDFRWLLALIALSLTGEWFIRKYNGLT